MNRIGEKFYAILFVILGAACMINVVSDNDMIRVATNSIGIVLVIIFGEIFRRYKKAG